MQIREAYEEDIPNILKVLKESLGEVSSKKTEDIWRYKHVDNPFGKSLVLLAVEDNKVIGVRAFMRWKWQQGSKIFSAFRAVDTATHPAHQGRGIFKKLTLTALEIAKSNGDHFVFNTPNANSKPGYLKMGWKELGKLQIQLFPVNPFYFKKSTENIEKLGHNKINYSDLETLLKSIYQREKNKGVFTPKNVAYLKWRYEENPIQDYLIFSDKDFFLAAYIKSRGNFKEFRVSERICLDRNAQKKTNRLMHKLARKLGAHFVSSHVDNQSIKSFSFKGNFGPVLTLKNINLNSKEAEYFKNLKNWDYSIGELEIF